MAPSYSLWVSVITELPEKKGPLMLISFPAWSRATLLPFTKTPTTSLKADPTNSGYSSVPTTKLN